MNPIAFSAGCAMFGWLLPELLFLLFPRNLPGGIPLAMNLVCALALGLIGYAA